MGQLRLRKRIARFLEAKQEASTREIYDHINESTKWGVTMAGLANVLAKDVDFVKAGTEVTHTAASRYLGSRWTLRGLLGGRAENDERSSNDAEEVG